MSVPTEWIISLQGIRSGPWWTFKLTVYSVHWVDYTGMNNLMFHPPHTWTEEHNNTVRSNIHQQRVCGQRGKSVCESDMSVSRSSPGGGTSGSLHGFYTRYCFMLQPMRWGDTAVCSLCQILLCPKLHCSREEEVELLSQITTPAQCANQGSGWQ